VRFGVAHDSDVDLPVQQQRGDVRGVALAELQPNAGVVLLERADALGGPEQDRGGDEADVEAALYQLSATRYWTSRCVVARMVGMTQHAATAPLQITSMSSPADAEAFRALNEEWITTLFTLEDADRAILEDPAGHVVDPGGDVLIARDVRDARDEVVGCVALVPFGPTADGVFELSKMAVAANARGRGVGRALLRAAIERAGRLGARSLFLGSNKKLADAVHLYESVGFRHVAPEEIGPMPYVRADIFMRLTL
jgi:putative acetyltransferase